MVRHPLRPLGIGLAALMLCPAGGAASSLSAEEIARKVVGQPMIWRAIDGPQTGEIVFGQDGEVVMTTSVADLPRDIGTWRIVDGELCTRWRRARAGSEKCYALVEAGPGVFRTTGGNVFEIRHPMI